jgi:hypothetical protein
MAWGLSLATSQSTNAAGNQSTVSATLSLTWNNADRYSGFTTSGSISIGGNVSNFTGPTSGGSTAQNGSQVLHSHSVTFTHDVNGFRGAVGTSGSFDASGTNTIAPQNLSTSGTTFAAIDYNRSALQASAPSVSRSSNGLTLSYSAVDPGANNSGPARSFDWNYRTESGGWIDLPDTSSAGGSSVGVDPHTTYRVRVLAYNSDGNNGWSAESVASHGIPNVPSNPSATRSTGVAGRIDLSWGSPAYVGGGVTKYQVYRNGSLVRDSGTSTTFEDTGLVRGTTYNYTINAVNSTGIGTSTGQLSAIAPGVPNAPAIPTVTSKIGRNLVLNSQRGSSDFGNAISEYRIQLSTDGGTTWKGWNNATKTFTANNTYNVLDPNGDFSYELLAPALTYEWRVYAVNSIGEGDIATTLSGTFVSSGGKRWNGTTFVPTETAKRKVSSGWQDLTVAKRWNGTSWQDLS